MLFTPFSVIFVLAFRFDLRLLVGMKWVRATVVCRVKARPWSVLRFNDAWKQMKSYFNSRNIGSFINLCTEFLWSQKWILNSDLEWHIQICKEYLCNIDRLWSMNFIPFLLWWHYWRKSVSRGNKLLAVLSNGIIIQYWYLNFDQRQENDCNKQQA